MVTQTTTMQDKPTDDARQGYITRQMRPILYISTALTISGLALVALFSDVI